MVEKSARDRVGDHPRADGGREWEVFVRDDEDDPMRHVGSVTAPTADVAHEQATTLFAWYATDVWLTPADAVARYSTHDLDDAADPADPTTDGEERSADLDGEEPTAPPAGAGAEDPAPETGAGTDDPAPEP